MILFVTTLKTSKQRTKNMANNERNNWKSEIQEK